jgi:hypothetical protein
VVQFTPTVGKRNVDQTRYLSYDGTNLGLVVSWKRQSTVSEVGGDLDKPVRRERCPHREPPD